MNPLIINGSSVTPSVILDHASGKFEISGRSLPPDSVKFYNPVCRWFEEYKSLAIDHVTLDIRLDYFDTSSSKCLFDIFKLLKDMMDGGSTVMVNWYYVEGDYDMKERGEEYQTIAELPFTAIQYKRAMVSQDD